MRIATTAETATGGPEVLALTPMEVRDLPDVMAIERASFPAPWSSALFLQELRVPFSRIFVARRRGVDGPGSVLGYVCRWRVADETHILNVAVHPAQRRRGLGTVLVGEVVREAVADGAAVVILEVRRSNAAARALYRRLAFAEIGARRNYYGAGEDALVMQRTLVHA